MNRPIMALALGAVTLLSLPLTAAEVKKEKAKKSSEARLNKLQEQIRVLKEQQVDKSTSVTAQAADCTLSTTQTVTQTLPTAATTTTKRYYLVPLSSVATTGAVVTQSVGATVAPVTVAPRLVSSQAVTLVAPAGIAAAAPTCAAQASVLAAPVRASACTSAVSAGALAVPYAYSSSVVPTSGMASSYLVNSASNFQTLQIRGGRTFVTSPSVTRPYVLSGYEAAHYGVTSSQPATVFSSGVVIPPAVSPAVVRPFGVW